MRHIAHIVSSPRPEQIEALRNLAARNRRWKMRLLHAWETGDYSLFPENAPTLQQIRNEFGPAWLVRFRLPPHSGGTQ